MAKRSAVFKLSDLQIVDDASEFRYPGEAPMHIGDVVMLNSGGPHMMVVDTDGDEVVCSWRDEDNVVQEWRIPEVCVHRVSLA